MLFDMRPKTRREDLFDRDPELKKFNDSLPHAALIVVTGLRRTGKTSFLDVALSCINHPYVIVDVCDLPTVPSRAEIIKKVDEAFNKMDKKWKTPVSAALKHVKGVYLAGASITFGWDKKGIDLAALLDEIDAWAKKNNQLFLLAFDEIQLVRGDKYLPRLLARIADTNRNTVIVITGSEVGLLYDFLGFDNPESPLFGRHFVEISMSSFTSEQSKEFLKLGFKQVDIKCPDEVIEYAIEKLDGVAGWLTLFGLKSQESKTCTKEVVDETLDVGGRLARSEALKIAKFSHRYGLILDFLAQNGEKPWSAIKDVLDANEGRKVTNTAVTELLNRLIKTNVLMKVNGNYRISDPILTHGLQREPLCRS